jgi:DNA-directed RNA polymerase subunit RPC12/RpoP
MLYKIECQDCNHTFTRISTKPEGPGTVPCPECGQLINLEPRSDGNSLGNIGYQETNPTKSDHSNAQCSDEGFT